MAIQFDGATRRVILDSAEVSASEIWSRWVDWVGESDNSKWPQAMMQVGGDPLGGGLYIPPYIFLLNGWRIRPMEADHDLKIVGNLFVEGGGIPVVRTLGPYQVNVNYTVPVQAQAMALSGGGGEALTQAQVAAAVWNALSSSHDSGGSMGRRLREILEAAKLAGALSA